MDLGSPATHPLAGRHVRRIGLGTMRLSAVPPDFTDAVRLLRRAVELGVDHVDTSDYYGPHVVTQAVRHALHPYPPGLVLATKLGWRIDEAGRFRPAYDAAALVAGAEDNLRHLGLDALDVVNFRLDERAHARPSDLDGPFEVLLDLQRQGKIRHLGISNASAEHVRYVRAHAEIVTVQNRYNLGATHDDPLIEELARDAIPYVSFFPLHDVPASAEPDLERLRTERGLSAAGAVLALLLERHPNLLLIPGTSSVAHLEENLQAMAGLS